MAEPVNQQTNRITRASVDQKCAARGCGKLKKDHPNIRFFRVPQTGENRRQLLQALRRGDLTDDELSYELCIDHFEPQMVNDLKILKTSAEPKKKVALVNNKQCTSSVNKEEPLQPMNTVSDNGSLQPETIQTGKYGVEIKVEPDYDMTIEPCDQFEIKHEPNYDYELDIQLEQTNEAPVIPINNNMLSLEATNEISTKSQENCGHAKSNPDIATRSEEIQPKIQLKSQNVQCCDNINIDKNTKQTQTDANKESQSVLNVYKKELLKALETKKRIQEYKVTIKSLEYKIRKLKQNNIPKDMLQQKDAFTKMLIDLYHWNNEMKAKYKDKRYSTEFKYFALNLYVSSKHIYKKLATTLDLPNETYINNLKLYIPSMLNEQTLSCLSNKLKLLPNKAKYCSVSIATTDVKQHLYYNITRDEIIGLQNINGDVSNAVATTVYFIMLRGIVIDWKQPVAYAFFATKSQFIELEKWFRYVIMKLSYLGFKVMAISSSQEQHLNGFAEFQSVSVDNPFITVNGSKIYYIFDAPHMLTSLRNDLIYNDFYYSETQKISWSHIETLYAYKKKNLLNVLSKLTDLHISPSAIKCNELKYATQIFSQSVYSTFDILMAVNYIPKEAKPTAQFIKTVNDLFDILNSSKLKCDNENRSAFTLSDNQVKTLTHALHVFQKLHAINKTTKGNVTKEMHTFKNMQITIKALIFLTSHLKELGIKNILTRRLNSEPVKKLKKQLVMKNNKIMVTPITFVRMFSKQFFFEILRNTKTDKYQGDVCEFLMKANLICNSDGITLTEGTPKPLAGDQDYRFQLPKQNAFTYVASYLLFKCSLQHKCTGFDDMLLQCPLITSYDDINQSCNFSGRLRLPPAPFNNYVRKLDDTFKTHFPEAVKTKPVRIMLGLLQDVTFDSPCKCFPTEYLLTIFIRLKIYSILRNNMSFIETLSD